jgi:hypothetical protein
MASVIYVSADAETHLAKFGNFAGHIGASMIRDQLLYIRVLAPDSFELRKSLMPILECLNNSSPSILDEMQLTPRERQIAISMAAEVPGWPQSLNPEAIALITDAERGRSVADMMEAGAHVITP